MNIVKARNEIYKLTRMVKDKEDPCPKNLMDSPLLKGRILSREEIGMPHTPTKEEIRLRELAEEYHRTCEEYDRAICTGPVKDGSILPANGEEYAKVNRHARGVRDNLLRQVAPLGFDRRPWMKAIQEAGFHYRHKDSHE